jgi:hypothetical protein
MLKLPNFSRINVPKGKMKLKEGTDLDFGEYKPIKDVIDKIQNGS